MMGTMPEPLLKFTFVYTSNKKDIAISVLARDLDAATKRAREIASGVLGLSGWSSYTLPVSVEEVVTA